MTKIQKKEFFAVRVIPGISVECHTFGRGQFRCEAVAADPIVPRNGQFALFFKRDLIWLTAYTTPREAFNVLTVSARHQNNFA